MKQVFDNLKDYHILLVSGSPRRRELLERLGLTFTIGRSEVEETYPEGLSCEEIPQYLSRLKAMHCSPTPEPDSLVIAADTIVCCEGRVLGKPASYQEAFDMLRLLSGRRHRVITGVTILTRSVVRSFHAVTTVTFAPLTDEEIDFYLTRFRPYDKAGAYGIQEWIGMIGVKDIQGSYYNVMGLPVFRLYDELKQLPPCC